MRNPAELLEGMVLEGGWTVGPLIPKPPQSTGGNFCQRYEAVNDKGRKVFVKALDFSRALGRGRDQTRLLQEISETFNFEVDVLKICSDKRMDRVVRAIASGTADVDSSILGQVPYLIFEAADRDVRRHLDLPDNAALIAWKLRALHHVATGLMQLHGAGIAHQDLKPSNVLIFKADANERVSKIADMGRASRSVGSSPFDHLDWPGDPNYKPPEAHYDHYEADWHKRRIAYDLYMLGSLISFLFVRTTANAALWQALPNQFWPGNWQGSFREVLPYLNSAFSDSCAQFAAALPGALATDLMPVFTQLCEPDPTNRGHARQPLNKIALERFITRFDVMSRRADRGRYGFLHGSIS